MKMTVKKVSLINFHPTKDTSALCVPGSNIICVDFQESENTTGNDDGWKGKPIKHIENISLHPSSALSFTRPPSHKQHNKQQAINLKYLSVRFWEIAVFLCMFAGLFTDGGAEEKMQCNFTTDNAPYHV